MLPESLASLGLLAGKGLSPSKLLRYGRAYTGRMAGESKFHGEVRRVGCMYKQLNEPKRQTEIGVEERLCAHHACCVLRQVLGYVTPWNRDGYVVSETFAAKLSYVSPVWYQLREEGGKVVLTGGHDVGATRGRKACHAPVLHDSACVRSC